MRQPERDALLVVLTECRAYVGDMLPPATVMAKSLGFGPRWFNEILRKLEAAGLVGIQRCQVMGDRRLKTGRVVQKCVPSWRLRLDRVGADDDLATAFPPPVGTETRAPSEVAQGKILAIARLALAARSPLPTPAMMAAAISLGVWSFRYHARILREAGRLIVKRVTWRGRQRLVVVRVEAAAFPERPARPAGPAPAPAGPPAPAPLRSSPRLANFLQPAG